MNKYIFLTPGIGNMGGGQKYTENKVRFLKSHGWDVYVFFYKKPLNVRLPLLSQYSNNYLPELRYRYYSYTKRAQKKLTDRIKSKVGEGGTTIVESHLMSLSCWGEIIAQGLGACHIINFIDEGSYGFTNKEHYAFLEYKLKRWQLLSADNANIHRMFGAYFKPEFLEYQNPISFECSNVVDEKVAYDKVFDKCDYTIIAIGRLEKTYVMPMVEEIKIFAEKYNSTTINAIFVGGSPDGTKERIITNELSLPNINVYLLGYLYPIPGQLLGLPNVAIGTSNTVLVTANYDIPTISLDMNDGMAMGVYGYTTNNKWLREDEPKQRISELLEEILIKKKYQPKGFKVNQDDEVNEELTRQLKFVEKSLKGVGYYDVNSIPSYWDVFCAIIKRVVHSWLLYHKG